MGCGIKVDRYDEDELREMGVYGWPTWGCEVSEFPWTYDEHEECLILAGEVEVVAENGESVAFKAGDYVTFPKGLSCTWKVTEPVRKHYTFK